MKSTVTEVNDAFRRLLRRLDSAKEKISELEDRSIEITTEMQKCKV